MQKQQYIVATLTFFTIVATIIGTLAFPRTTESIPIPTQSLEVIPLPINKPVATTTVPLKKKVYAPSAGWSTTTEVQVKTALAEKFTPEDARIALAVLKQESHLNTQATGYNCFYDEFGNVQDTRSTSTRSKSCLPEHREHAWSLDCGIGQNNFVGVKSCPEYTRDLEWSINTMAEMHAERGFKPWVAYTKGLYKPYLK